MNQLQIKHLQKSNERTDTRKRFKEGDLGSENLFKIIEFVIRYVSVNFLFDRVSCIKFRFFQNFFESAFDFFTLYSDQTLVIH